MIATRKSTFANHQLLTDYTQHTTISISTAAMPYFLHLTEYRNKYALKEFIFIVK